MPVSWRWDQGRLTYFQFDKLRSIATVLVTLENSLINATPDPLRGTLVSQTGLPFLPDAEEYRIWRNYGRVFGCACLAANIGNRLVTTEICRRLASGADDDLLSVDEYLAYLVPRFYFPSPVFQGYEPTAERVFPYCVVLRYLLASVGNGGGAQLGLQDVFSKLIGNNCSGSEPLSFYGSLSPTGYSQAGDGVRQVREMLIFLSQFSFLKWAHDTLFFDVELATPSALLQLERLTRPIERERNSERRLELLAIGGMEDAGDLGVAIPSREMPSDVVFTEGKKVRVTHLRTERSARLRRLLFDTLPRPFLCNMCDKNMRQRYPWVENLLEIHHLLPLGSPIRTDETGTSLADLAALCPNCHRSVHRYYRDWLSKEEAGDFRDYDEARSVYREAKEAFVLGV